MARFLEDKNVRITLVNPTTWEHYDIYFRLFETELAKKWVKAFEKMNFSEKRIREKSVKFSRSNTYTLDTLTDRGKIDKINRIIDYLNSFYDREIRRATVIDQDTLNYLHEEYEIYGNRLAEKLSKNWWDDAWKRLDKDDPQAVRWPGIRFNEEFHTTFLQLNDTIHTLEMFFNTSIPQRNNLPTFSNVNILMSYDPRLDYEITEEDSASFFPYYRFGDLVLGYNTLGKNISHIVLDEDTRAAEENAVVLQTTWSNEIMALLGADNATPDYKTKQYHRFKKVGLEQHGWKFGDHRNREGYLLIGHLYEVQEDDLYKNAGGLKMDLTPFSSVKSVEIVSDTQMTAAYTNPTTSRIPHWKGPLPLQGKKIIEIKNESWAIITWILNDICNYSCRYCPPVLHEGKNHLFDWDVVEPFLDDLFLFYGLNLNKKLLFSLSGGEPTLSPFFPDLVKKIHTLGGYIGITTNLARTPRYIEENFKYLSYAGCSFHPAQEFPNNTADEWIEKVKIASNLTMVTVRLMMDPLYWDKCIEFIDRIKNETTARLEVVYIDDQYGSSKNKLVDLKYTPEQSEFFKNFKTVATKTTAVKILETNPLFRKYSSNAVITYEDSTSEVINSPQMLINKGQTNFFDFRCAIGTESMFIHQYGHIKRGNCEVGGIIGNVKDHKKIDWNSLLRTVICDSVRCSCGADIPISKKS
jgi:MoaA/NifB/PqqE/SkfB family radical SAM enzyme